MTNVEEIKSRHWWICIILFIVLGAFASIPFLTSYFSHSKYLPVWLAGAGAIGLLSGYTTGVSNQSGITGEFLKFVSGGIIVPIVGGIATLIKEPVTTFERYLYADNVLVEKITGSNLPSPESQFSYLIVLGGFLIAYCLFATTGIFLGVKSHAEKVVLNISPTTSA